MSRFYIYLLPPETKLAGADGKSYPRKHRFILNQTEEKEMLQGIYAS